MDDPEPAGPDLVALLYRADWTTLRLSARVSGTVDFAVLAMQMQSASPLGRSTPMLPPAHLGIRRFAGSLRLAPGGRYETDITEPADIDRADVFSVSFLRQHGFSSRHGNAPGLPPYPDLLCPSRLLNGFTLELRGEITGTAVAGRRVLAVTATAAPGALADLVARPERIEVLADADTGILLRSEETFEGRTARLTELSEVTFGEPGGAFIPSDADEGEDEDGDGRSGGRGTSAFSGFSGPGWTAARTATNAAGGLLGSVIAHAPGRQGSGAVDPEAAMPPDDEDDAAAGPAAVEPSGPAGVSDELLHAMYGSGRAEFSGTLHTWTDMALMTQRARSAAGRHGWEGVGSVIGAVGERLGVVHTSCRVQTGSGGRYRVEYITLRRKDEPRILTCDGEQLWREYADKVVISPATPLKREVANMVDTSPLLEGRLTVIRETTIGGRRAFALRAAGAGLSWSGYSSIRGPDIVIDAELGIVLRFVWRDGGEPAYRWEFRDVAAGRDEDTDFRGQVPPGFRVVHADGTVFDDVTAGLPEPVRVAAKAAGTGLRAARGVLDYWNDRRAR